MKSDAKPVLVAIDGNDVCIIRGKMQDQTMQDLRHCDHLLEVSVLNNRIEVERVIISTCKNFVREL